MTLYLLDANVLIRADGDYYPLDRIPAFWTWLSHMAEAGRVKIPVEIYGEIDGSPDRLGQWLRTPGVRQAMILDEPTDGSLVARVLAHGYAADLNDVELEFVGRDPFLVAAALGAPGRVVVSREVSAPSKLRFKRKIPDVCATWGVTCISDFEAWRRLDFRIG